LIEPRLTTPDDVRWAFRVLRCTEAPDSEIDAILRRCRSLPELREWVLRSPGFVQPARRRRCEAHQPQAEQVRWAYRLLRFTELDGSEAERIAAESGSLAALVDGILADPADVQALSSVAPRAQGATVVFSKSMPRSGHHLLVDLLLEYFGRDMAYCEFYGDSCCGQQPCQRASLPMLGNHFFIQKSHDLGLNDPKLEGSPYIVQYRHPIPRLQSNWDHFVHVQRVPDTEAAFRAFARAETDYFIRFWHRWVVDSPAWSMALAYESLSSDPRGSVSGVVTMLEPDPVIDQEALDRAVSLVGRPAASSLQKGGEFVLREAGAYRYQLPSFYRALEATIYGSCPGLDLPRRYG
jgi:hypothetical protein